MRQIFSKFLFTAIVAAGVICFSGPTQASQNLGVFILNPGGTQSQLGITAAGALTNKSSASSPTTPGKLREVVIVAPGTTSGAFTFYDVNFIGAYSSTTQYYPGQGVTSGGTVYVCILASLGNATSNATYWSAAPVVWSLAYNASTNVAGAIFTLNFPFQNGIYLGAVPGAGSPSINAFYD